ncbi:hypothetical protein HII28_02290 [Planctomonas sp. JC2975]|uniref:hypothetical protein n=1 Tax=Planctomonas sp. JC2975 TaxID=2729626 RepID=UPI0014740F0A|nr:hypothetical protein [Planctomonas sp. JC2975]NNC10717.1 hypothetical protein [Planctomonas sp. JC2975]
MSASRGSDWYRIGNRDRAIFQRAVALTITWSEERDEPDYTGHPAFKSPNPHPYLIELAWHGAVIEEARAVYENKGGAYLPQPSRRGKFWYATPWQRDIAALVTELTTGLPFDEVLVASDIRIRERGV